MNKPEQRLLRLELQHAIAAIERAWLLADDGLTADLLRLLGVAKATLDRVTGAERENNLNNLNAQPRD